MTEQVKSQLLLLQGMSHNGCLEAYYTSEPMLGLNYHRNPNGVKKQLSSEQLGTRRSGSNPNSATWSTPG